MAEAVFLPIIAWFLFSIRQEIRLLRASRPTRSIEE